MSSKIYYFDVVDRTSRKPPTADPHRIAVTESCAVDAIASYVLQHQSTLTGRDLVLRITPDRPRQGTFPVKTQPPGGSNIVSPTPRRAQTDVPARIIIPPENSTPVKTSSHSGSSPVRGSPNRMSSPPPTRGRCPDRGPPNQGVTHAGHRAGGQQNTTFPSSSVHRSPSRDYLSADSQQSSPTRGGYLAADSQRSSPTRSSTPADFDKILRENLGVSPRDTPLPSREPSPSSFPLSDDPYQFVTVTAFENLRAQLIKVQKKCGAYERVMEVVWDTVAEEFEVDDGVHGASSSDPSDIDIDELVEKLTEVTSLEESIAAEPPLDVKRALVVVQSICLRRCLEILRNVLVKHMKISFGPFAKKSGYRFKTFKVFYTLFKATFISSKGKPHTYKMTDKDYKTLNEKLTEYFVARIGRIRDRMMDLEVWSSPWDVVLTPEFITWLLSVDNELQEHGNESAHPESKEELLDSLEKYITGNVLADELKARVTAIKAVMPSAIDLEKSNVDASKKK
ncbi:hypothetical protein SCHPADRAFT_944089 [Schizopora paradoxa]|uniref:Uncharacterized protein n=1 Tax=Schizopora paradoxa TaxID=27342 RepID=A0A0H2RVK8_9AGAM|nr:hypothetical protein SCHPADRAFT_944089 [Schizopora paradoxa]